MFRRTPENANAPAEDRPGFIRRLRNRLNRGNSWLTYDLGDLLRGRQIDAAILEELETRLITADVGVEATERILAELRQRVARKELTDARALSDALRQSIVEILEPVARPLRIDAAHRPFVILVVGVNGSGKTTTIGKLAARYARQGKQVIVAAGDTYRAAAIDQLAIWAERAGVEIVKSAPGGDPAAVAFDALKTARSRGLDVVLVDTAGRLQTDQGLMDELAKIQRVMRKEIPSAPHEVLLVLDANTGQNAIRQAQEFKKAVAVTGIALTKLDGTAKGGVVLGIAQEVGLPVRYAGLGESLDDLADFDAPEFARALFSPG